MDEFLPREGYPKRVDSIICGNFLNLQYAGSYSATYAIFPFYGVPIGVTYGHDFLETRIAMSHFRQRTALSIMEWNALFLNLGLFDETYAALRADVQRMRGKGGDIDRYLPRRHGCG